MPAARGPAQWARRILILMATVGLTIPMTASANASDGAAIAGRFDTPVVATANGPVRGLTVDGVRQFRGIPYAAPPVGELRWRAPQPAADWHGVRDATTFGAACAQVASPFGQAATLNEDCLFLNVYLPRFAVPGLPVAPVMVWIHGGGLTVGEGSTYDPAPLVARGVVVVTINYRLGALGFLAHPALAAESPHGAAGNYGLMDQQAALRWVQRNIRHFGGNPRNVTIFGESAGGLSVHEQLVSPLAGGLFAKAIDESGAYQPTQATLGAAEGLGTTFATAAGCADQSAACLRTLPVEKLLANQTTALSAPTLDGFVLTTSIKDAFDTGAFNRVPIIEGSNHDEWRLFVAQAEATTRVPLSAAAYIPVVARTLNLTIAQATALVAAYPLANYASPSIALGAVGTDAIFACTARRLATGLAQFVPTFQYEFNDPNAPQGFFAGLSFPTGAYHAAEIQYLFRTPSRLPVPAFTPEQEQLSAAMVRYWTQFAWIGNPNSFETPFWPRFDEQLRDQALVPGNPVTATDFATDHHCALFPR